MSKQLNVSVPEALKAQVIEETKRTNETLGPCVARILSEYFAKSNGKSVHQQPRAPSMTSKQIAQFTKGINELVPARLWEMSKRLNKLEPAGHTIDDTIQTCVDDLESRITGLESKLDDSEDRALRDQLSKSEARVAKLQQQIQKLIGI